MGVTANNKTSRVFEWFEKRNVFFSMLNGNGAGNDIQLLWSKTDCVYI